MRVCVDEIETEFTELTATLKTILRSSREKCIREFCTFEDVKKNKLGDGEKK